VGEKAGIQDFFAYTSGKTQEHPPAALLIGSGECKVERSHDLGNLHAARRVSDDLQTATAVKKTGAATNQDAACDPSKNLAGSGRRTRGESGRENSVFSNSI